MAGVSARAGVVSAIEVNGPMATENGAKLSIGQLLHPKDGSTWALIWFLVAVFLLFIV